MQTFTVSIDLHGRKYGAIFPVGTDPEAVAELVKQTLIQHDYRGWDNIDLDEVLDDVNEADDL